MAVELTFTGNKSGVAPADKQTVFGEIDDLNQSESSTSGTYHAENCAFQPERDDPSTYRVHIGLSLRDADDSDYPNVKDDLAEAVAGLSVDFGTKEEVKEELVGEMT